MILGTVKSTRLFAFIGDLVILNVALIASYLYYINDLNHFRLDDLYKNFFIGVNLAWIIAVNSASKISYGRVIRLERIIRSTINVVIIHLLLISVYFLVFKAYYLSRFHLFISYSIFAAGVLLWRIILTKLVKYIRTKGGNSSKVAIIGSGMVGQNLGDFLTSDEAWGYELVGFFDDNYPNKGNNKVIGTIDDAFIFIKEQKVNEIYCCLPDYAGEKVNKIIQACDESVVLFRAVPDFTRYIKRKVILETMGRIPIVYIRQEPLQSQLARLKKRAFDLLFSSFVIIFILSWLYPLIGLLIKLCSKGPVLFKQKRTGKDNGEFMCLKFRSMHVNEDSHLKQAGRNDSRLHKLGSFLRKSSIDELPQFFNVFIGEMSIVGPRPHMVKHTEEYSSIINKYMVRHFIKPGITGWAQVNGYRGETKDPRLMEKRVQFDVWYIENWSLLLDVKIVINTVVNAVKGEENAF